MDNNVHVQYRGVVTKGRCMKNFSLCTESRVEAKNKEWMVLGCYNFYYELVKPLLSCSNLLF